MRPPDAAAQDRTRLQPFGNIKRSLVQLIGVLSFRDRDVADQVRASGGVQLILSMTQIDVANPCTWREVLLELRV